MMSSCRMNCVGKSGLLVRFSISIPVSCSSVSSSNTNTALCTAVVHTHTSSLSCRQLEYRNFKLHYTPKKRLKKSILLQLL
jgi:hypothetical protein